MNKAKHVKLLLDSFAYFVGRELINRSGDIETDLKNIENANWVLVSHNGAEDPILNYGNPFALNLWELDWESFTQTPSRKTAEIDLREKRQEMLLVAEKQGYYDQYEGVRISSKGKRFQIKDAIIWNVIDEKGTKVGQAATFNKIEFL